MDHFVGRTNSQPNFFRHPPLSQSSSITPHEDWNSQPASPVVDAQHLAGELYKHQHRHQAGRHLQNVSRRGSLSGNEQSNGNGRSQNLAARELLASLAGLGPAATQLLLRQPRTTAASCSGAASPACLSARQSQTHSGWQSPIQQSSQNNLVVDDTSGAASPNRLTPSRTFSRQGSREMKRSSSASGTLDDLVPGASKQSATSQIANIKRVIAQARQPSNGVTATNEPLLSQGLTSNGFNTSGRKHAGAGSSTPKQPQQLACSATARPQVNVPPRAVSSNQSTPLSQRPVSAVPTVVEGPPVPAFKSPLMQIAAGIRAVNNQQFNSRRPTTAQPVYRQPVQVGPAIQTERRPAKESDSTGTPQQQALATRKSSALLPSAALPLQPSTQGKLSKERQVVTQGDVVHQGPVRCTTVATLQPRPPTDKPPLRPTSEAGHVTAAGSWSPVLNRRNLAGDEAFAKGRFSLPGNVRQAHPGASAETSPRQSHTCAVDNANNHCSPTTAVHVTSNTNAMCLSACNSVMSIESSTTLDRASSQDVSNHNPIEWMGSPVTQKPRFRSLQPQPPNQALLASPTVRPHGRNSPADHGVSPAVDQKSLNTPQGSFVFQPSNSPVDSSKLGFNKQVSPQKPDMKRGHTSPLILTSDSTSLVYDKVVANVASPVKNKEVATPVAPIEHDSLNSSYGSNSKQTTAPGPLRGWAGRAAQRSAPGSDAHPGVHPNPLQPSLQFRASNPGIDSATSKRASGSPISKLPTADTAGHVPGSIYQSYQRQMGEPMSQEVQTLSPITCKPASDPVAKQAADNANTPLPNGKGNLISSMVAVIKEKGAVGTDKNEDAQNMKHVPQCKVS